MRPVGQNSSVSPTPLASPLGRGWVRFGSPFPPSKTSDAAGKKADRPWGLQRLEDWLEARGVQKIERLIPDRHEYYGSKKERRLSRALKLLDFAILLKERRLGNNANEVLDLYLQVGNLLKRADRKFDAYYYLDTAWERQIQNLKGEKCPKLAELLACRANFYDSLKYHHSEMMTHPRTKLTKPLQENKSARLLKAEMLYRKALGVWRYLAENEPSQYDSVAEAQVYTALGEVAYQNRAFDKAEGLLEKAFFSLQREGNLSSKALRSAAKSLRHVYQSKYGPEHTKTTYLKEYLWHIDQL